MDALMLKNVSKAYENFQLKDISFTLPEGTIMGLIGENGAGKSTIINCIMDLVKRDSGEITVLGQQMDKDNLALREDIGIVFEMFNSMISSIQEDTVRMLYHVHVEQKIEREQVAKVTGTNKDDSAGPKKPVQRKEDKVYPNDPCPCGSGKKYKQCCGRKAAKI